MPRITLTEARVEALRPRRIAYDIRDGKLRGFGVRVLHSGKKRFFLHCQHRGERVWKIIGDAGTITVTEARSRAAEMLAAIRRGEDALSRPDETLFEALAATVFERYARVWKAGTLYVNRCYLRNQLLPRFAGCVIADIDPQDVRKWFASLRATPVAADRSMPVPVRHHERSGTDGPSAGGVQPLPGHPALSPQFERLSTTVMNAYVGPRMARYLETLLGRLRDLGFTVGPHTIHSNGGMMSLETVRRFPVRTCLSGIAAGVIGAAEAARQAEFPNIVTFDVGGTSTDVSLVRDSAPLFTTRRQISGFPITVPMLDIHVIGAGGGSIAAVDDARALKVGPRSAGASPGPVTYRRGGVEPTLTDANLVLGRLSPRGLIEGTMPIDREAAARAIEERIAKPLAIETTAAAAGIVRTAVANMTRAIRAVSTEKGHDVADFALFAYGGAGPLHAAEVARECGIPRVVVPPEAGTMCARGILMSDISLDFVRSEISVLSEATWTAVRRRVADMIEEAHAWLEIEQVGVERRRFRLVIDTRYRGQNHEVRVDLGDPLESRIEGFREGFARAHESEYGYVVPDRDVEIVNCRIQAIGPVVKAEIRPPIVSGGSPRAREDRQVWFEGGWRTAPVYARSTLGAGTVVEGPAIIEEMSSTAVVLPGQCSRTDDAGNLIIEEPR